MKAQTGHENFSSPSFHKWAVDYYKCVQDFRPPGFSPVPYALLCRAIELELKSRHLAAAHLPSGDGQRQVKDRFGHHLVNAYNALPDAQKVLNLQEFGVLVLADAVYNDGKGFEYITPGDAGTAYSRFPDLAALNAMTKKLLDASP